MLKCLLDCGISPCSADYLGRSLLHIAVDRGHRDIVQYLFAKGVDINAKDWRGETPIDLAVRKNNPLLEFLLANKVVVNPNELRCKTSKSNMQNEKSETKFLLELPGAKSRADSKHEARFTIMRSCPTPIAAAMLQGQHVEPLSRSHVSLFFSDVVGFTAISSAIPPIKVARMLDSLFKRLDRLAHLHGVQKVDVVGDAYIAATNFTEDQPGDHAARLARFALDAVAAAAGVEVECDGECGPGGRKLQIRVGMHCGAVTGIVADRGALKYTLIGDAARVAALMESGGKAGTVQCSAESARLIEEQASDMMVRERCAHTERCPSAPPCVRRPLLFSHFKGASGAVFHS